MLIKFFLFSALMLLGLYSYGNNGNSLSDNSTKACSINLEYGNTFDVDPSSYKKKSVEPRFTQRVHCYSKIEYEIFKCNWGIFIWCRRRALFWKKTCGLFSRSCRRVKHDCRDQGGTPEETVFGIYGT